MRMPSEEEKRMRPIALTRGAALICAMELERKNDVEKLGKWPFEIGLWVGQAATPNRMGKSGERDENTARARTRQADRL